MAETVIDTIVVRLVADISEFGSKLAIAAKEVGRQTRSMSASLKKFGDDWQNLGTKLSVLSAPVTLFGASTIKTAADFQSSMNELRAIMQASADDVEQMRQRAMELGESTQFTATQVADAMTVLAKTGQDTKEVLETIAPTLDLAAASGKGMDETADLLVNTMKGMQMPFSQARAAADVLAKTFASATTDLGQLGEAFVYSGATAKNAGMSFEDTAATLALLAEGGFKGSMGGTALRGAIAHILNPTKEAADLMKELNIQLTDATGRMKPMEEVLKELEPHLDDAGMFLKVFGQRAGPGMQAMVGQGVDQFDRLRKSIEDADGAAQRIGSVKMQGFSGELKKLQASTQGLQLSIADTGFLEDATKVIDTINDLVKQFNSMSDESKKMATQVAEVFAVGAPAVVALGVLAGAIAALATPAGAIAAALGATAAAIIIFHDKIFNAVKETGDALKNMNDQIDKLQSGDTSGFVNNIVTAETPYAAQLAGMLESFKKFDQELTDRLKHMAEEFWGTNKQILDSTQQMSDEMVGHSIIPDMMDRIGEEFARLDALMVDPANRTTQQVIDAFRNMFHEVVGGSFVPDMVRGVDDWFSRMGPSMTGPTDMASSHVSDAFGRMSSDVGNTLTNFATTGKGTIRDMVDSIISDMRRLAEQQFIMKPLNNLFSGLLGGLFGGGSGNVPIPVPKPPLRAGGGNVAGGHAYMVGERGPELFVPGQSGRIDPSGRIGGASPQIVFNVRANDVNSFLRSETQIAAMLSRASQRGMRNL